MHGDWLVLYCGIFAALAGWLVEWNSFNYLGGGVAWEFVYLVRHSALFYWWRIGIFTFAVGVLESGQTVGHRGVFVKAGRLFLFISKLSSWGNEIYFESTRESKFCSFGKIGRLHPFCWATIF